MRSARYFLYCAIVGVLCLSGTAQRLRAAPPPPEIVHSKGNPIIADGSYYSADPAPLVANGTLYILAGHDEAPVGVNDFVMKDWQILATKNVGSGIWMHYPSVARPETVFKWAAPGHAYAGQIVQGPNHRFYMYSPVTQAHSQAGDPFGIGVAVSNSPVGPWKDAHPAGPIVSQSTPGASHIQNIDPTVWVDDDKRVYMYWGTFGQLRGVELKPDMVTPVGKVVSVNSLTGYFEAPWLFKRGRTYYLAYAGNQAGAQSNCTPAVYHACIAYGTSNSPLGPWTYRGVILGPVSSTTSHDGIIKFKGQWYLVYHTADAKGGGHFRRSVAIDRLYWDDSTKPASMRSVIPTRAPQPPRGPRRNIAPAAIASASNQPVPLQYWMAALNDEIIRASPLPPDMWGNWVPHHQPAHAWLQYAWGAPVSINASRMVFWADHPAGASEGVAPPAYWTLEYWNGAHWQHVGHPKLTRATTDHAQSIAFDRVTTRCLRAVIDASGHAGHYAAIGVQEWAVLAPSPVRLSALPKMSPTSSAAPSCSH